MNDESARWQQIWNAINDRRVELGLSWNEVYERGAISQRTMYKVRDQGTPIASPHKRAGLATALGWASNSIDVMLDGGNPIMVTTPGEGDVGVVQHEMLDFVAESVAGGLTGTLMPNPDQQKAYESATASLAADFLAEPTQDALDHYVAAVIEISREQSFSFSLDRNVSLAAEAHGLQHPFESPLHSTPERWLYRAFLRRLMGPLMPFHMFMAASSLPDDIDDAGLDDAIDAFLSRYSAEDWDPITASIQLPFAEHLIGKQVESNRIAVRRLEAAANTHPGDNAASRIAELERQVADLSEALESRLATLTDVVDVLSQRVRASEESSEHRQVAQGS